MNWLAFMPALFHVSAAVLVIVLAVRHPRDRNLTFIAIGMSCLAASYTYGRVSHIIDLFWYGVPFDAVRSGTATLGAFWSLWLALGLWWRVMAGK